MSDLRSRIMPHPTDPSVGNILNVTAVVELARRAGTPESIAFLRAFHEAEADVAREKPFLSEVKIRGEAVIRAMSAGGHRVVREGGPT